MHKKLAQEHCEYCHLHSGISVKVSEGVAFWIAGTLTLLDLRNCQSRLILYKRYIFETKDIPVDNIFQH